MRRMFYLAISLVIVPHAHAEQFLQLHTTASGNSLILFDTQTGTVKTITNQLPFGYQNTSLIFNPATQTASYLSENAIFSVNVITGQVSATANSAATLAPYYTLPGSSDQTLTNQRIAATFGGGAGLDGAGLLTFPTYVIQGVSFNNVGAAFSALDTTVTNINNNGTIYFRSNSTGPGALASGENALAAGSNARSSGINSIAIGTNAQATQNGAIAMGFGASSTGANAIAIGTNALATDSVAIGFGARASNGGASFGDGAVATGPSATAVGPNASATVANGTAIGNGATVTAPNSVAIGNGSLANQINTVSVGSVGNERRITNVAPGVAATDAATVGQLTTVASGITANFQGQIDDLRKEERRGIAANAALATAMTPSAPGKTTISLNTGFFQGEAGVGIALAHRLNMPFPLVIQGGYANGGGNQHVGRVGMAFEF